MRDLDTIIEARKKADAKRPPKDRAGRCLRPKRRRSKTGISFVAGCNNCMGCWMQRHDEVTGGATAEAVSSCVVLALTLTVANDPETGQAPYIGQRLVSDPIANFRRELNREHDARVLVGPEYCPDTGRCHWHCLVFFQWSARGQNQWKETFKATGGFGGSLDYWQDLVPKMSINSGHIPKDQYNALRGDPETLLLQVGVPPRVRLPMQSWKYWPHGHVVAHLVKDPFSADMEAMGKTIRYITKYATKDTWKDSKLKETPFELLPEWVKQTTRFHKNERGHFCFGNPYRDAICDERDAYMRDCGETDETAVPLDLQPFNIPRHKAPEGGLGRLYFEALGEFQAQWADEKFADRLYKVEGATKPNTEAQMRSQRERTGDWSASSNRLWKWRMSDAQFLTFMDAFNAELVKLGKDPSFGRNYSHEAIKERREFTKMRNAGPFGYDLWHNAFNQNERDRLEEQWSHMTSDQLEAVGVPRWLNLFLEEHSSLEGWKDKARQRRETEKFGPVTELWRTVSGLIEVTSKRHVFYTSFLETGREFFRVELLGYDALERALQGGALPQHLEGVGASGPIKRSRKLRFDAVMARYGAIRSDRIPF